LKSRKTRSSKALHVIRVLDSERMVALYFIYTESELAGKLPGHIDVIRLPARGKGDWGIDATYLKPAIFAAVTASVSIRVLPNNVLQHRKRRDGDQCNEGTSDKKPPAHVVTLETGPDWIRGYHHADYIGRI